MPFEDPSAPRHALSPSRLHTLPWGVAFGMTDIGPVRQENEDNFLIDETLELAMVTDGMGGHAEGAVASATALVAVQQFLRGVVRDTAQHEEGGAPALAALAWQDPDATGLDPNTPAIHLASQAIEFANTALYTHNVSHGRKQDGMGTTLTGLWQCPFSESLLFFHVGDSRLYRYRAGSLIQLTRDQTLYQQALDMGAIANLPARNLLLQAMGPSPEVTPEIRMLQPECNDLLMLCSDGLHGSVPHGELENALIMASEDTLETTCERLIGLAKAYGGRDNITVLLVWLSCPPRDAQQPSSMDGNTSAVGSP